MTSVGSIDVPGCRLDLATKVAIALGLATLFSARSSPAFYEDDGFELRATMRVNETGLFLPTGDHATLASGSLRLIGLAPILESAHVEVHGLALASGATEPGLLIGTDDRLFFELSDRRLAVGALAVDRLILQVELTSMTIRVGRQPVNLATSYYFTPNDFFSPFAAQTFFRLYKPGVDAARVDIQLGELSELTLVGALDSSTTDLSRASALAKGSTAFGDFSVSLLGGRRPDHWIVGGAFQGTLFDWLGVRGEGHVAIGDNITGELSVNIERQFENTLSLRVEGFYHGAGACDVAGYTFSDFYSACAYLAAGVGYQLSALTSVAALGLVNLVDGSTLMSGYVVYSLLDDAEAALSVTVPFGARPDGLRPRSELGTYPLVIDGEVRVFF